MVQNYYQYRHVQKPGWKIGWTWTKDEVIKSISGAYAARKGNCSAISFQDAHSCEKQPEILDLDPNASPNSMIEGCCKEGVLSAYAINPDKSYSIFMITIVNSGNVSYFPPKNLTLMAPGPGYTCGPLQDSELTVFLDEKRQVQAFRK